MAGYLTQRVYYISLLFFCIVGFIEVCSKYSFKLPIKKMKFFYEAKIFVYIAFAFLLISLFMQLLNRSFGLYTEEKLVLLLMPVIIVFIVANAVEPRNYDALIFIIFARICLQFILEFGTNFNLYAIRQISWLNTNSSLFESTLAHDFCLITFYFLFSKKKKLAVISTILCLLSFKRFSFIVCILTWIVYRFVPERKVGKKTIWIGTVVFLITTFIMNWLYSDAGVSYLFNHYGFDLNAFTTDRVNIVRVVTSHFNGVYNGFGSISNYFDSLGPYWAALGMHCDILKIFYETTIIGSFSFIYGTLNICKRDYRIMYVYLYFIVEIIISQFIQLVNCWVIFFIFVLRVTYEENINNLRVEGSHHP